MHRQDALLLIGLYFKMCMAEPKKIGQPAEADRTVQVLPRTSHVVPCLPSVLNFRPSPPSETRTF